MASVSDDFSPPRVPLETDVECLSDVVVGTMRFPTLNVGEGGLFIKTAMPLSVGTGIHCTFCLPDGYDLSVEGEVAWARKGPLTQIPPPGMGVRFTSISLEDLDRLQEYVDQFKEEGAEPEIQVTAFEEGDVIELPLPPPPVAPVAPVASPPVPVPPAPESVLDPPAPPDMLEAGVMGIAESVEAAPVRPAPPVPPAPLSGVTLHSSSSAPRAPFPPAQPDDLRGEQPGVSSTESAHLLELPLGVGEDEAAEAAAANGLKSEAGEAAVGSGAELRLEPWGLSFGVRVVGVDPPTLALEGASPVGYLVGPDGKKAEVALSSISFDPQAPNGGPVVRLASWKGADQGQAGAGDLSGASLSGIEVAESDRRLVVLDEGAAMPAGVPTLPHDVEEDSAVEEWERHSEMPAPESCATGFDDQPVPEPAGAEPSIERKHGHQAAASFARSIGRRVNRLKSGRKNMSRVAVTVVSCLVLVGVGAAFAVMVGSKKARRRHEKKVSARVAAGNASQQENAGKAGLGVGALPGRRQGRAVVSASTNAAGAQRIADRRSNVAGHSGAGDVAPVRRLARTRRFPSAGATRRNGRSVARNRGSQPVVAARKHPVHSRTAGPVRVTKGPLPIRRQGERAKMLLAAKGRPAKLSHYWLASPPGVVVDMGGVRASLKPGKYAFKDADVRFVRVLNRGRGVRFIVYFKSKTAASSARVQAGSKGGQLVWRTTGPTRVSMR